jgi:hypothetical protein
MFMEGFFCSMQRGGCIKKAPVKGAFLVVGRTGLEPTELTAQHLLLLNWYKYFLGFGQPLK